MLVHNPIQAQECRSIDTMVMKVNLLENYKRVWDTTCTSMIPKINGYPHLKIVNQFTGGQYVNLVPQEHTVLRHCDVLDRQSNVTLMKNVVEAHFCGYKAAN